MDEFLEALKKVLLEARRVVPTREGCCPLMRALNEFDDACDNANAIEFMRRLEQRR